MTGAIPSGMSVAAVWNTVLIPVGFSVRRGRLAVYVDLSDARRRKRIRRRYPQGDLAYWVLGPLVVQWAGWRS